MAQYGFRIFKVERMNGTGNTPVVFADPTWGDFGDHLHRSYAQQVGRKWHENPRDAFDDEGGVLPLDPNSRIVRLDWVKQAGTSLFFVLSAGKNDGFVDAMTADDDDADVSIGHLAPRRQYRGVYTLPPKQTEGVLALECISRACPVNNVLRPWTNRWSEEMVKTDSAQGKASTHTRVRYSPLSDGAHVSSLLNQGDPQEVVLIEHKSVGNGLPDVVQYRLAAPIRQKANAMATVKNWVQKQVGMDAGIDEARVLVGPEVADVAFDDCYVAVKHEGQTQHVRPDSYSEVFTYDNRNEQRETGAFFRHVNEKLASMGLARTMHLDLQGWPVNFPALHGEAT